MSGQGEHDTQVHRALASDVRLQLLEVLRDEPGLDAAELADRLGLHANTVRSHLNVLVEAGLVGVVTERRDRPGRPRSLYLVIEEARTQEDRHDRGYRFLAGVLAGYLDATSSDPAGAAAEAGSAWGRYAVEAPPPFTPVEADDALARLISLLDDFGFAPRLEDGDGSGPQVVLGRCPFIDVAREHEEVVCSVHLGIMRGALEELGADVEVLDLVPWAHPDGCVSHLRKRAG